MTSKLTGEGAAEEGEALLFVPALASFNDHGNSLVGGLICRTRHA